MVPESESLAPNISHWVILLCVSLLASACGDEPAEKTASCQCPEVETVPATARYQASQQVYTRSAPGPVTPSNQMYMMQPPTFVAEPARGLQTQRMPAAEPVWGASQQTFQAPQNTAFQNQQYQQYQQNTVASPWAMPQQSAPVQQFQNTQRPWGQQTAPVQGNQPRAWGDTSRQQPNNYQWGVPVGGGYYGQGSDPYGATQGAGYPGYVR